MPQMKLTIGMATYDDYDGVYFSIQAIRMYHPEVLDQVHFLVVDNHPESTSGKTTAALQNSITQLTYLPYTKVRGTAARDCIFREAKTEWVLCMDAHIFFVPGSLKQLLDYFEQNPKSEHLLQGPLLYDDLVNVSTHFEPVWQEGMWGRWALDERGAEVSGAPFAIPMQGLGVFICRRDLWPGLNPRFRGFGGEEGYLHEKFRQAGNQTLCLPFLRWMHRFNRPLGTQYANRWEDRIRNYLIGHFELDLDIKELQKHYQQLLGRENYDRIEVAVNREIANPCFFFDGIYWLHRKLNANQMELMEHRFQDLGIGHLVREVPYTNKVKTIKEEILAEAQKCQFNAVLLIADVCKFEEDFLSGMRMELKYLKQKKWHSATFKHWEGEGTSLVPQVLAVHAAGFKEMSWSLSDNIVWDKPET